MKLGIVGLPNVGKSTLFNSLTKAGAESANYPFCTIDPNVGVVTVPDERLNVLGEMYHTKKIIPAAIEFVDIAGLVKGASKGEGLGNQFLANIREVDAIVHVVRCFEDSNIVHVDGSINPLRDIETINLELIFSDLEILERRISKTAKVARNDKAAAKELALLEKIKAHLEEGKLAKTFTGAEDEEEESWLLGYNLLTYKPVIYAANVAEDDLAVPGQAQVGLEYPDPRLIPLQEALKAVQRRASLGPQLLNGSHTVGDDLGPGQDIRRREPAAGRRAVRDGIFRLRQRGGPDGHLVPGRLQLDPPQLHPDLPQRVFQLRGAAAFPKGPYGQDQERPNGEGEDEPQIF